MQHQKSKGISTTCLCLDVIPLIALSHSFTFIFLCPHFFSDRHDLTDSWFATCCKPSLVCAIICLAAVQSLAAGSESPQSSISWTLEPCVSWNLLFQLFGGTVTASPDHHLQSCMHHRHQFGFLRIWINSLVIICIRHFTWTNHSWCFCDIASVF